MGTVYQTKHRGNRSSPPANLFNPVPAYTSGREIVLRASEGGASAGTPFCVSSSARNDRHKAHRVQANESNHLIKAAGHRVTLTLHAHN